MFAVGDIVRIYVPQTGYFKFHLCIHAGVDGAASQFLYLNSEHRFEGAYPVPCEQVPCIPASDTGLTVFSFNMVPRYNEKQLKLFRAEKLGEIDPAVAAELLEFAMDDEAVPGLSRPEKETVRAALRSLTPPADAASIPSTGG